MNRRKFLQDTGKYTLAAALPFILPSGRLFAATGEQKIKHVVYCLFAGGIRNWESIDFKEGNLMPNILAGNHTISNDIKSAMENLPRVLDSPLQQSGTLFKGFRYNSPVTLHYNAHATAISGQYANTIELMKPVKDPTIFEFFRKHHPDGARGLNTWWISDQSGPFPFLQYSSHSKYGYEYAANMIHPSTLFKYNFTDELPEESVHQVKALMKKVNEIRVSDKSSSMNPFPLNSEADKILLSKFINKTYQSSFKDKIQLWDEIPSGSVNDDFITLYTASEILTTFHPSLLVVNIQDSDIAHSNFTDYCKNLNKADFALAKMWQTIQNDPILKDNTVLVVVPEFGRNATHNSLIDAYGRYAVDHTGDAQSMQMFCLIAGPEGVIQQNKVVKEKVGETIDILPTIAHLMGFHDKIPSYLLKGKVLHEALV
jgi:hypothetical protein